MKWWHFLMLFSFFDNCDFLGYQGLKWEKMTQNDKQFYLTPYLRNRTSYDFIISSRYLVRRCKIMISSSGFLYFLKIQQPSQQFFFLISSCFSSSSINAKQKFWGVLHVLHICVSNWLNLYINFYQLQAEVTSFLNLGSW